MKIDGNKKIFLRNDTLQLTGIYAGDFNNLVNIGGYLEWYTDGKEQFLTLNEILFQYGTDRTIRVFVQEPFFTEAYVTGYDPDNLGAICWHRAGQLSEYI